MNIKAKSRRTKTKQIKAWLRSEPLKQWVVETLPLPEPYALTMLEAIIKQVSANLNQDHLVYPSGGVRGRCPCLGIDTALWQIWCGRPRKDGALLMLDIVDCPVSLEEYLKNGE